MRLIDADELKDIEYINKGNFNTVEGIRKWIDNAPTVETKEITPLVNKAVEVLPELTDAIIDVLPEIVSKLIKCSECSYYRDTWNVIPRPKGEWIGDTDLDSTCKCSICRMTFDTDRLKMVMCDGEYELPPCCPHCGAKLKGGAE